MKVPCNIKLFHFQYLFFIWIYLPLSHLTYKGKFSASLSINDIYDEVIKKDGGLGMDLERVRASLIQLGCQIPTTGIDETYSIDTHTL